MALDRKLAASRPSDADVPLADGLGEGPARAAADPVVPASVPEPAEPASLAAIQSPAAVRPASPAGSSLRGTLKPSRSDDGPDGNDGPDAGDAPTESPPKAGPSEGGFDASALDGLGAPAAEPVAPVAPVATAAPARAAPPRPPMPPKAIPRPAPAAAPAADLSSLVENAAALQGIDPGAALGASLSDAPAEAHEAASAGLDAIAPPTDAAAPGTPEAKDPAKKKDDEDEDELYIPGDAAFINAVATLLRSGSAGDEESLDMARTFARDQDFRPEAIDLRDRIKHVNAWEEDYQRRKAEEDDAYKRGLAAARQMGGGGGLVSALAGLLGRDPRKAQREAADALRAESAAIASARTGIRQNKELMDREANRRAEDIRDRFYNTKDRQYRQQIGVISNEVSSLNAAVRTYDQAFLEAPAAAPLKAALAAWAERDGLSPNEARTALAKRTAPAEVLGALDAVRDGAMADPIVADARRRMRLAEDRFAESVRKAASDAELMARNFNDEKFDTDKCQKMLELGVKQAMDLVEDPIAEEESRQKMKERMRELMSGIMRSFENLAYAIASVVRSPGR